MLTFNLLLTAVIAHAVRFGGTPERIAAALFAAAALATIAVASAVQYDTVSAPLFAIDAIMFAGFLALALVADRYWPMWMSAIELFALASHAAKAFHTSIVPDAYWILSNQLAWLMLALLVIGTSRHRERKGAGLPEHSWSRQRDRANPSLETQRHRPCGTDPRDEPRAGEGERGDQLEQRTHARGR